MSTTPIPTWMENEVLERDGWTCLCCGIRVYRWRGKVRSDSASIDHIIPDNPIHRGLTVIDNLQTLCRDCNSRKGSRIIDYRPKPTIATHPEFLIRSLNDIALGRQTHMEVFMNEDGEGEWSLSLATEGSEPFVCWRGQKRADAYRYLDQLKFAAAKGTLGIREHSDGSYSLTLKKDPLSWWGNDWLGYPAGEWVSMFTIVVIIFAAAAACGAMSG